ncbi:hypothetical protein C6P45_003336 [Maudiozyma exigua]|uniref:Uncharacterized protein n=1 Tax=Maudiozyma exigua TaxID=34358 RepID=A0A9P6VUX5_MAUEX|nr:hypothetical protein C6P45_003336 [Kazachstania exigua]
MTSGSSNTISNSNPGKSIMTSGSGNTISNSGNSNSGNSFVKSGSGKSNNVDSNSGSSVPTGHIHVVSYTNSVVSMTSRSGISNSTDSNGISKSRTYVSAESISDSYADVSTFILSDSKYTSTGSATSSTLPSNISNINSVVSSSDFTMTYSYLKSGDEMMSDNSMLSHSSNANAIDANANSRSTLFSSNRDSGRTTATSLIISSRSEFPDSKLVTSITSTSASATNSGTTSEISKASRIDANTNHNSITTSGKVTPHYSSDSNTIKKSGTSMTPSETINSNHSDISGNSAFFDSTTSNGINADASIRSSSGSSMNVSTNLSEGTISHISSSVSIATTISYSPNVSENSLSGKSGSSFSRIVNTLESSHPSQVINNNGNERLSVSDTSSENPQISSSVNMDANSYNTDMTSTQNGRNLHNTATNGPHKFSKTRSSTYETLSPSTMRASSSMISSTSSSIDNSDIISSRYTQTLTPNNSSLDINSMEYSGDAQLLSLNLKLIITSIFLFFI